MATILSLVKQLRTDFPQFSFISGKTCAWQPQKQQITFSKDAPASELLHELAHAILNHQEFNHDIELLKMERAAWNLANQKLAKTYEVTIDENEIEDAIESYREWLHQRSLCPDCKLNGLQKDSQQYYCLNCRLKWRVNDGRRCQLKRTKLA